MKKIPLTQGKFVKVDKEDFKRFSEFKWLFDAGYAKRHKKRPKVGWIMMHREILNAPDNLYCDHINGDKLDNRRENLRLCTNAQNMMNRQKQANNTSGFRGVSWSKQRNKWRACIKVGGKQYHLGFYSKKEDAAKVYEAAAKERFKQFYYAQTT